MDDIKQIVNKYIKNQEYTKAIDVLTKEIGSNNELVDLYVMRGDVYNLKQEYAKALNDYIKAQKLNPADTTMKAKISMINDILKFQNIDIYASTNLNNDPWLDI